METPVHSHFHKVYSTVLVSAALFVVGELETVQATNLVLGETLEAAVTPNMLSQSPASITFSEASATADPTAVEYKEILEAQIPALTASVMISFCEEEMKVKFKEQEKIEITKHLTQFFKNSPVCRIEDGKVKLLMTAAYADDAAKELMPYFVNKIDGRLKVGYEVGAFLGGHDNMNAYVWGKIKKHLKTLKATDAKNTFIKDIWSAFKKLNKAVWDTYKTETGEEISFTIGDYLTMITATFPNLAIAERQKNPPQNLSQSISKLDYTKW